MNISKSVGLARLIQMAFLALPIVASAVDSPFEAAVEYIPEHSEILLGEPLYVTFSVTNKGLRPFYLETGGDYRLAVRQGRFAFSAVDAEGVAAKDPHPDAKNMGGFVDFPIVKPRSAYSQKLFLPLWIKFDHPGRYQIHAKRELQLYAESSPDRGAAVTNSGIFDFYVTVIPANSNLMGRRIQQLGEETKIPEQASDATWALAYIDDERVIPYLLNVVEAYKDKGDALYPGIDGLGRHPSVDSTRGLIKLLKDPKHVDAAEYEIMEALSKMKSPEAKGALRDLLNSPDAFIRKTAAEFLGQMGDQDSIDALKSHLTDNNSDVRLACSDALAHLNAFDKRLNLPVALARILDTANPSVTNHYNYELFALIAENGGPKLSYNFAFHRESTESELAENRKALAAMLRWANSPNSVPEH